MVLLTEMEVTRLYREIEEKMCRVNDSDQF